MPQGRRTKQTNRPIESYDHRDKERLNNPPVGLARPEFDRDAGPKSYSYDPHLDPQLQWAGKTEHTSFEVPTVSLHVHERMDPRTIIEATRRRNGDGSRLQGSLFELPEENPPFSDAIKFYGHRHNWKNRLVAGDSLLVMNSLLEKEGMAGKVQMIYMDPPYGISYGSNFQPFVDRREVKDGRDEDLTQEPETIKAFRDTWELEIHSYLSYLRDRLLLARELLTESGSCFVQISEENLHHVRELMQEVFGANNLVRQIAFRKTSALGFGELPRVHDILIWYAKDRNKVKYRQLFEAKHVDESWFSYVEADDGSVHRAGDLEDDKSTARARRFALSDLKSSGYTRSCTYEFEFNGRIVPAQRKSWRTHREGMTRLILARRLYDTGKIPRYKHYYDDFMFQQMDNMWNDTAASPNMIYAVQTQEKVVERCLLMTTDPGDLTCDPTCGSGTTAYVAERWGRRWITCDTSRVAIHLAKQRLMTASFAYYELAHPSEGVGSGFNYRTVPHVTLGSIANNPDIKEGMTQAEIDAAIARHAPRETLYDQPLVDTGKRRVTGPFSVEAVPAPAVRPVDDAVDSEPLAADSAVVRSGETLRQSEWLDELLKNGVRGKGGQFIRFARLEPLPDCRHLHADGESLPSKEGADAGHEGPAQASQRVIVSFGPEYAPLEQRQVNLALQEMETLWPSPRVIVFAAFQFDPEAAKVIDRADWPGKTLLKVQMSADLLTEDLKRSRASNESFWLIGQPDVHVDPIADGEDAGKFRVSVQGFDYYNTRSGDVESGGKDQIAMWMLDTDYDGRSLYPRQVFFPMSGSRDGWSRLARNLKAEIDEDLIEAYRGTVSLPFEPGEHRQIAVKIVDDRGIESLRVEALGGSLNEPSHGAQKTRSITEMIVERGKKISQEARDRVPDDLIDRLDYYTAGAEV